jgi:hypothetical protein
MLIGVDFDNTIVSYDALFHRVARERDLIPADLPINKTTIRDHLRAVGREDVWTAMQGEVYGARMAEAEPFAGVVEFFAECRHRGIPVVIISHKTRYPYLGEKHDLHAAARTWLTAHGFIGGDSDTTVYFELTKSEKLARISQVGCTDFVDDLPELLSDAAFPRETRRILFAPQPPSATFANGVVARSWSDVASTLLEQSHLPAISTLLANSNLLPDGASEALSGGANNQVYRQRTTDGQSVLIKRYFRHGNDRRDRFATERAFYEYAAAAGVKQLPRAIGWDETEKIGVFSFLNGTRPAEVKAPLLDSALGLFRALNVERNGPLAAALPLASEACFSFDAHLQTVRRRIATLSDAANDYRFDSDARQLVTEVLQPAWETTEADVRNRLPEGMLTCELSGKERCISPSDFGFHNSLVTAEGAVFFFDFEYAGWDDPAKLVCDFFCQPEVPAPSSAFEAFANSVAAALELTDRAGFLTRCRTLQPVYLLKWSCIMLNDFTAVGQTRRAFSLGAEALAARRARQLKRVRRLLAELLVAV